MGALPCAYRYLNTMTSSKPSLSCVVVSKLTTEVTEQRERENEMEAPNAEEEDEEEGGIFIHTQQGLKDWQKIRFPPLLPSSSNHRAHSHTHSRAPWEMMMNHRSRDNVVVNDDCFIFPPSNHEGLHIVAEEQHHDDDDVTPPPAAPEAEPQSSMSVEVERSSQEQPLDLRIRDAGEILLKRLGLGFEMLWLKFIRIGALFRSYYNNNSSRNGVWWCTSEPGGVTVGLLLVPLLYWWQRTRRRARQEKKERLILLIQRTDEKLSLLLDQITHINEVLSARHKIPILRSG